MPVLRAVVVGDHLEKKNPVVRRILPIGVPARNGQDVVAADIRVHGIDCPCGAAEPGRIGKLIGAGINAVPHRSRYAVGQKVNGGGEVIRESDIGPRQRVHRRDQARCGNQAQDEP